MSKNLWCSDVQLKIFHCFQMKDQKQSFCWVEVRMRMLQHISASCKNFFYVIKELIPSGNLKHLESITYNKFLSIFKLLLERQNFLTEKMPLSYKKNYTYLLLRNKTPFISAIWSSKNKSNFFRSIKPDNLFPMVTEIKTAASDFPLKNWRLQKGRRYTENLNKLAMITVEP